MVFCPQLSLTYQLHEIIYLIKIIDYYNVVKNYNHDHLCTYGDTFAISMLINFLILHWLSYLK